MIRNEYFEHPEIIRRYGGRSRGNFLVEIKDDLESFAREIYCRETVMHRWISAKNKKKSLFLVGSEGRLTMTFKFIENLEKELGLPESTIIINGNIAKIEDAPYWYSSNTRFSAYLFFIRLAFIGHMYTRKNVKTLDGVKERAAMEHWFPFYEDADNIIREIKKTNLTKDNEYIQFLNEKNGIHSWLNNPDAPCSFSSLQKCNRLLVYGQLRSDGIANYLLGSSKLLYTLNLNEYNLYSRSSELFVDKEQGLFKLTPTPKNVLDREVEVYEVDDAILAACDSYEGHPDFYTRDIISIKHNGRRALDLCWAYLRM